MIAFFFFMAAAFLSEKKIFQVVFCDASIVISAQSQPRRLESTRIARKVVWEVSGLHRGFRCNCGSQKQPVSRKKLPPCGVSKANENSSSLGLQTPGRSTPKDPRKVLTVAVTPTGPGPVCRQDDLSPTLGPTGYHFLTKRLPN